MLKVTREHQDSEDLESHDFRKQQFSCSFLKFLSQRVEGEHKVEDWALNKLYIKLVYLYIK